MLYSVLQKTLLLLLFISCTGCYLLLPEDRQREVRKGYQEAQQGYKNANPYLPDRSPQNRIRNLLEIGLEVDQIYDLLGDPDHINTDPTGTFQCLSYLGEDGKTTLIYVKNDKVTGWQDE
ncbi:MAG TPA: hypothetical protein VKP65_23825 [Rhodothermales bacterium]|nr:hypothetical protein [Rhodothermales bacterium]